LEWKDTKAHAGRSSEISSAMCMEVSKKLSVDQRLNLVWNLQAKHYASEIYEHKSITHLEFLHGRGSMEAVRVGLPQFSAL